MNVMRVGIVGGSYGGLCAALALRCVGHEVDVYERSPDFDRIGGGIVVQPEFAEYLETFGYARPEAVAVPTTQRRFLHRDGSIKYSTSDHVFYTAWDTLLRSLRDSLDPARIHNSMELQAFTQTSDGVECVFGNGTHDVFDLLVAADGIGSTVRHRLLPEISPLYGGYVAFRGLVPEGDLSDEQAALIEDSFVLFDYPHSHILNYLIPGQSGSNLPGTRRWNWVWYVSQTPNDLAQILTDRDGRPHRVSLGPGELSDRWIEYVRRQASNLLPHVLAGVVAQTKEPFVQAIFDLAVSRMVFDRVVLIGDAACLVRPHTASGTSKAAGDAIALAHALEDAESDLLRSLCRWESERLAVARRITAYGKMIAARGGLGG